MIDAFSILFSTGMILLVLLRAVRLDRLLPWFEARPEDSAALRLAPPARGRPGGGPRAAPPRAGAARRAGGATGTPSGRHPRG